MVTNYPVAAHQGLHTTRVTTRVDSLGARVMAWMRQSLCGLTGHDTLMHYEADRLALQCVSCGHESPGWNLNEVAPTVTVRGDARRHALVRKPRLVSVRRIA
jgi:hypothetical protein